MKVYRMRKNQIRMAEMFKTKLHLPSKVVIVLAGVLTESRAKTLFVLK